MSQTYTRSFQVRQYELDRFSHVNNAVYLNYLQQAAIEANEVVGYSPQRYQELGFTWVASKTIIEYNQPLYYGDNVTLETWISAYKRIQAAREYRITKPDTNEIVAVASTNWVLLNATTLKPIRIPPELIDLFAPQAEQPLKRLKPGHAEKPTDNAHRYLTHRRVQNYELDVVQHVNNAVYLNWVEQAFFDACTSVGYTVERLRDNLGIVIFTRRNEIEYHNPALEGDELEITSWITTMARTHGTWIHEMRRASDQTLLTRTYATGAFLNATSGQPTRLPQAYQQAILQGKPN